MDEDSSHIDLIAGFKEQLWKYLPVAVYACNREGFIIYYNEAARKLWGRDPVPFQDKWCGFSRLYDKDGTEISAGENPLMGMLGNAPEGQQLELLGLRADGDYRRMLVMPGKIYSAEGIVEGIYCTITDISHRDETERKQAFFSSLVDSSDDAIISKSLDGIITSWNAGAEKIFGYREEETIGRPITLLIPPSRLAEEDHILSEIRKGNKVNHFQTVRVHKTGREIPISLTISPIKDKNGRIIGASKIARDITEQVRIQQSLAQYTQNLETINELIKSISAKMDVQEILQQVTDATTKLTGASFGAFFYNRKNEQGEAYMLYTLSGVPRAAFEGLGMPRNTSVFAPTFNGSAIVRSDDIRKDERFGKNAPYNGMPEGHLPVVSYLAVPVVLSGGIVIGGLFFGHREPAKFTADHEAIVTGIAAQAAIALDNSRLFEEVKALNVKKDEFIALASHELKTPLTTISGYLQIMDKKVTEPSAKKFIDKTINQVARLNRLIADLLDVSKIEAGKLIFEKEKFDLVALVKEMIESFRYINNAYNISFNSAIDVAYVTADKHRIEQVINNLLGNAVKYSPDNFNIEVRFELVNGAVKVIFKDYGIGLTQEQQSMIFSRFYRAENTNRVPGLGLGLYLTKEIINRHEGKVGVNSVFGKGSEFYFTLSLD